MTNRLSLHLADVRTLGTIALALFAGCGGDKSGSGTIPVYASKVPATAHAPLYSAWAVVQLPSTGMSKEALGIRVGALVTDLDVDAAHKDTTAKMHANALATTLTGVSGADAAIASLREKGAMTPELRSQILGLVDERYAAAGAYLEAARISGLANDEGFFDRTKPAPLVAILKDKQDHAVQTTVTNLETFLSSTPKDPVLIAATVDQLLRTLAH